MTAMEHHVIEIRNLLAELGWHINPVDLVSLEWWADEMWVLESVWSPQGKQAWLTFLVDPLIANSATRQKGESVWAIMLTTQKPWNWQDDHTGFTMSLGRQREKAMKRLDAWLKGYRNTGQ
ncbi:MAG: hypothetical protein GX776_03165 [Oxalobacter sp.]|nr:hypothetical protein [Oxalobacter sp.]